MNAQEILQQTLLLLLSYDPIALTLASEFKVTERLILAWALSHCDKL